MLKNTKTLCHIIIKILSIKNKERTLKVEKEKDQVTYKERPIGMNLTSQWRL